MSNTDTRDWASNEGESQSIGYTTRDEKGMEGRQRINAVVDPKESNQQRRVEV